MGFKVVKGDLLDQKVDAIVVPSRPNMGLEGGLGQDIADITGDKIKKQIDEMDPETRIINFGEASEPFDVDNLPCKKLIFVTTPRYPSQDDIINEVKESKKSKNKSGTKEEKSQSKNEKKEEEDYRDRLGRAKTELKNCYISALEIAYDFGLRSVAFPLLSSGVYKFPKYMAAELAIKGINEFFAEDEDYKCMEVSLVIKFASTFKACRDPEHDAFKDLDENVIQSGHLVSERSEQFKRNNDKELRYSLGWYNEKNKDYVEDFVDDKINKPKTKKGFLISFYYYMVMTCTQPEDCYKGIISRQAFDKIRTGKSLPQKYTLIAMLINANFEFYIIKDLVKRLGFSFEHIGKDKIIKEEYEKGNDVRGINEELIENGFEPLPTYDKTK